MFFKITLLLTTIMISSLFAQNFSVGLNVSKDISSKNYIYSLIYDLEIDYFVIEEELSIGISASYLDARIDKNTIKYPPANKLYKSASLLGFNLKYYPRFISSEFFKPFVGVKISPISSVSISAYAGMMTTNCNELHSFEKDKSLHSFIKLGSDLIVDKSFNFVIGFEYLINNPKIKYSKPICGPDGITIFSKQIRSKDNINLSGLFINLGIKFKF